MKKRILITGGSRGIGRACVELFASQGHSVAFIYNQNHTEAAICKNETGAICISADISDPTIATCAAQTAIERLGGIDVLINNAGISMCGLFSYMSDEEYYGLMDDSTSSP